MNHFAFAEVLIHQTLSNGAVFRTGNSDTRGYSNSNYCNYLYYIHIQCWKTKLLNGTTTVDIISVATASGFERRTEDPRSWNFACLLHIKQLLVHNINLPILFNHVSIFFAKYLYYSFYFI